MKYFNDSKSCTEYSNDRNDIYKNIEEYNPNKKRKILIAFDDNITCMLSNKKVFFFYNNMMLRKLKVETKNT